MLAILFGPSQAEIGKQGLAGPVDQDVSRFHVPVNNPVAVNRGQSRGYWWSPDSSRIAFLQIDDRPVSTFLTIDDIPYGQTVETWEYPRAGDPNPIARLGVVRAAGGTPSWIDTSKYSAADSLIVRVGWTPDSRKLAYEVQNRTQTWLDLDIADTTANASSTILRETGRFWINSEDATSPIWLDDGSFLWQSGRSGWHHLYHYSAGGTLLKQVTDGKWELRRLHGIDEATGSGPGSQDYSIIE